MKIIENKLKKGRKRKKGKHFFRRIGRHYYSKTKEEETQKTVSCVNMDHFKTYEELKQHVIFLKLQKNDICLFGDARFAPMPFPIYRYYLNYNKKNFIGEEYMSLYNENAYLTFHLNYPEDFKKYKHIMHRSVYLGSLAHILIVCRGEAVLPRKIVVKENIDDYNIIILKDLPNFLPHHDKLKSFIQNIPTKI